MLNPFDDRPARNRAKIGLIVLLLILINLTVWSWAAVIFAGRPALMGTALLAYMLGLRHAFDGDHIAAIDNVVRKLRQEGKSPLSAGFFFSIGHSTVVILVCIAIVATSAALSAELARLRDIFDVAGTVVSAGFLMVIGIANLVILISAGRAYAALRRGEPPASEDFDKLFTGLGFFSRLFRSVFAIVTRSYQMYPIGFLFGLGFDTATEIGVLSIAATQAAQNMPLWTILVFPALFTAGMTLMDTADSALMTHAYGWAFVTPARKLWYNFAMTAASVGVAFLVGGIEALGLVRERLRLDGLFWRSVDRLNESLSGLGFAVVIVLIAIWIVSMAAYRLRRDDAVVRVRT